MGAFKRLIFIHLILLLHIKSSLLQKPTGNDNNNSPKEFNIGGVLSNNASEDHFRDTIAVSYYYLLKVCCYFDDYLHFARFMVHFGLQNWKIHL